MAATFPEFTSFLISCQVICQRLFVCTHFVFVHTFSFSLFFGNLRVGGSREN